VSEVHLELPADALEAIAERAAALVLASLPNASPHSPFFSVDEAAEFLRAKPQRVYDLLSAGRLSRFKDGSRVLVSRAELEAYLGGAMGDHAQVSLRKRE
jgi:excisionase family DNA binding protein